MLTKGMFGSEFSPTSRMFGLRCGQMRYEGKLTHNSGWYNAAGEKLGWGDLSASDVVCLIAELPEGEVFYILPERASYWEVPSGSDPMAPGVAYVREHAMLVVRRHTIYYINEFNTDRGPKVRGTLTMTYIGREDLARVCE